MTTANMLATVLASLMLGGCGASAIVSHSATEINRAYAEASESQLLVNVVRASMDRPMSFTRVTGVSPEIQAGGTIGSDFGASTNVVRDTLKSGLLKGPRKHTFERSITPSVEAGASAKAVLSIAPLESKEFYNGILNSLSADMFRLFYDSDYPHELVITLLVEHVDVLNDYGKWCRLRNNPEDPVRQKLFQKKVRRLLEERPYIDPVESSAKPLSAPIPSNTPGILEGIVAARTAKLKLTATEGGVRVGADEPGRFQIKSSSGESLFTLGAEKPQPAHILCEDGQLNRTYDDGDLAPPQIRFRSVEGIFRFLGKMTREQQRPDPHVIRVYETDDPETYRGDPDELTAKPLFVLRPGTGVEAVNFEGVRYAIPADPAEAGYSFMTLSLLNQLFYLSISSTDLPRSSTVVISN